MPASRAKQAETYERRTQLIRLKRGGAQFDDPRVFALGYTSRQSASKDFIRALEQRRDEQAAEVSVYRQEMNERLEALLEAAWDNATMGDPKAIETVLKVLDRQAKLNGLDAPVKSELSGPDGGPLALTSASPEDLAALISASSRLDNDNPANTATSTPDEDDDEQEAE